MKMRRLASIIALAGLFALAAGERSWTRAGSVSLEVSVQTNGLSPGFLEFDLSANSAPTSPTVSATIQNLVGGTPGVVGLSGGDFSGSLTSPPLVLNNNASLSFLQQGFTFLKFVTFDVTLSGSEVSATNPAAPNITGTLLSFFVEDSAGHGLSGPSGASPILGSSLNLSGESVDIYVASPTPNWHNSNLEVDTYGPISGNVPTVAVLAVPEPSSVMLLGLGLGGIVAWNRLRKPRLEADAS